MLPAGFSADVAPPGEQRVLRPVLPGAQTVATLRLGSCVCLLLFPRDGDDERNLRRRYTELGLGRDRIIAALERHRRGRVPPGGPEVWRAALAAFVAEHARNAGRTAFYLGFGERPLPAGVPARAPATTAAAVTASPGGWLVEGSVLDVLP